MTDIELRNENGKIAGYDPDTGQKVSVDFKTLGADSATINSATIDATQIAIGDANTDATTGDSTQGIAIGNGAKATEDDTVAVGEGAVADHKDEVMLGRNTRGKGVRATAVGDDAEAAGRGISIGTLAGHVGGTYSPRAGDIAISESAGAERNGDGAVVIGRDASATQLAGHTYANIAIGRDATADYDGTIAIGQGTSIGANGAIAMGHGVSCGVEDGARVGAQLIAEAPDGSRAADADLNTNEVTLYLDEANSNLVFKAKNSSGTVKTGKVSIA